MLITAIRRQRGGLFAVMCGEETVALVDQTALEETELAVGEDIDIARVDEIARLADYRRARAKALAVISRREICRAELTAKLSADFSEDICDGVADEMEQLGLVDDTRYAEMYADQLYRLKHYGYRRVAHELAQKGIDRSLAEQVASELAPDAREEIASLLEGRLARDLDTEAGVRRCINTLCRYGYEMSDIYAALRRLADEE
ncbi:MAG: regulatory protein RecX [Clostridia bacterium]|nr:regulatory protein RecX [Clostridia bacterium]